MLPQTLTSTLKNLQAPIDLSTWPEKQSEIGKQCFQSLTGKPPIPCQDGSFILDFSSDQTTPKIIQHIIEKMLMVREENRYLTQEGLVFDLQRCLNELNKTGKIDYFFPGMSDKPNQLIFHNYFFGRQQEIQELRQLYDEVCEGESRLVFVSGYSGVGKTAFVNVALKALASKKGFFISGKFDQYINKPYTAFVEALVLFCQAKPNQELIDDIQKAVAPNGQVLVDLVPEFEALLGKQPDIQELDSDKGKNRFNLVIKQLFCTIATKEHPLVVFLDDLQWVDQPSIELIELALDNQSHMLIIGSYRSNEWASDDVFSSHLFTHDISIEDLTINDIEDLLAHTFQEDDSHTIALTQAVYDKAHGNPFFVKQILQNMVDQKHIGFKDGAWHWKIEEIKKLKLADNVAELMADRLKLLSNESMNVLQYAACLGNKFSLKELAFILEKDVVTIELLLWDAYSLNIIVKLSDDFVVFLHDRIQQALFNTLSKNTESVCHYKIGVRLLKLYTNSLDQESIRIASYFNKGQAHFIDNDSDRIRIAELNHLAGNKAKHTIALNLAIDLYQKAIFLYRNNWNAHNKLLINLYISIIECYFLLGSTLEVERILNKLISNATTKLDKATIYIHCIKGYTSTNEYIKAIKYGEKALKLFNIKLDLDPHIFSILWQYIKIQFKLLFNTPFHLLKKPVSMNSETQIINRVFIDLTTPIYLYDTEKKVCFLHVLLFMNYVLSYEHTKDSPVAYSMYGMLISGLFKNYKKGYMFCNLAIDLNSQYQNIYRQCIIYFLAAYSTYHWWKPLDYSIDLLKKAYENGINLGDWTFAGYANNNLSWMSYYAGYPLSQIDTLLTRTNSFIEKIKDDDISLSARIYQQACANLSKESLTPYMLNGDMFSESMINNTLSFHPKALFYILKSQLFYSFNDYNNAWDYSVKSNQIIFGLSGMYVIVDHYFYYGLTALKMYSTSKSRKYMKPYKKSYRLFKKWTRMNQANFSHKLYLIQAEYARIKNKPKKATPLYDQSIQSALQNGFIQNAAIAAECAGRFYLEQKNEDRAKKYLVQAKDLFGKWGAVAKVRQMEEVYKL